MSRSILIVDDNAVTRKLVRFSLESIGLEVREAGSAAAALEVARAQAPDLVLQDLVLPDVDGFVLLERLREVLGPQIPILAFTGLLGKVAQERFGASGFDDVISKPIEPTRLREIVRGYFPDPARDAAAFGATRKVVLADDDAVQRKLGAFRLARLGFEVFPAGDGEEALALARANRPDVIVSDVLMPRMDGFELCSRVRGDAALASTPVVLLTNSYLETSDFELAKRVGADGYVVRTPELAELAAVLEQTLRAPARRTQSPRPPDATVQVDRMERALRQLDRQVALNAALTQRSAMLSAELTILGGLITALAEHADPDAALDTALSACFDAGGIAWGVLLVRRGDGWSRRAIGLSADSLARAERALERAAEAAYGHAGREPRRAVVPELAETEAASSDVLLAPIVHRDETLGALLLGAGDGLDEHRAAFAGVVAGQISLTLALGRTFRALEAATRAERARVRLLESTLDAIDDPIVVSDPRFEITHWNRAAERLAVHRRGSDPRSWPDEMRLFRHDQTTLCDWEELPIARALRGEDASAVEMVMLADPARPTFLRANARAVRGDDGRIESAVSVIRDVTTEKLAQAHQIVADRMASIGVLAAGVAHEINNPLSAVLAELDMAIEDTAGTPVQSGLELARDAAGRVRTIVRDLKTLSRGETDDVSVVDLARVLDSAVRMAGAEARQKAIVVREIEDVPGVIANEARLAQVFLNLLVNAAQAIPPGQAARHRITVRTRATGDGHVVAEVADTGSGMTPEVRARLFSPFFTTKPVGVGSGLGLSISQRIVASAGGTIEVDTAPGEGTTFRVRLPAAGAAPRASSSIGAPRVRRRVLAIGDDPLAWQTLSRGLRADHDVEIAPTAGAGMARLERGELFDAILLDVASAGAEGATAARVGTARPDLAHRIVLLLGSADHAGPAPHAAALRKPIDPGALRGALDDLDREGG